MPPAAGARGGARVDPAVAASARVRSLTGAGVLVEGDADVARMRERSRRRRLWRLLVALVPVAVFVAYRVATGDPVRPGIPALSESQWMMVVLVVFLAIILLLSVGMMAGAGRSPAVRFAPSEIAVTLDDVVGLGGLKDEVVKSLNLFLGYQTFRDVMGGNPRKGVLFEGPPGTGKTYMAKAMAREANVPFLFVSATAFQSHYYGMTGRKIRSFFKQLRKAAREEGGAIGFIEEIDAIAGARRGMRATPVGVSDHAAGPVIERNTSEGIAGVVNELLIQLQSFEEPTAREKMRNAIVDRLNLLLPAHRRITKRRSAPPNILVVAATNRAADLDPALLRPGRFDRSLHFDLPSRGGRRELIDYYLDRKAHVPELDKESRRDQLAAMTFSYSPVMIEHLFDEALVWALRDGRACMEWGDVQQAKLTEEIGLAQPVEYTEEEKRTIATHEAGHATVAYLVGQNRNLEVLSIIKRRDALGLLAHSDAEERFTHTRSELLGMMQIAFGGMVAEELFFGESGTGTAGDLAHATRLAAQMVGSFGMADSLVSYEAVEPGPLGPGIVGKVLADDRSRTALEDLLAAAKSEVGRLLGLHHHVVVALRDELLDREELVGDEIAAVCREAEARHELGV